MSLKNKIAGTFKKQFFTDTEFERFKNTATYDEFKNFQDDQYIVSDIAKDSYKKSEYVKRNRRLYRAGRFDINAMEIYLGKVFKAQLGRDMDFSKPKTLSEKLQWLKLHYQLPLIANCYDSFALKRYVEQKIGAEYVIDTIGFWVHQEHIDFSELPEKCVFKVNRRNSYRHVMTEKTDKAIEKAKSSLAGQLKGIANPYFEAFNWGLHDLATILYAEPLFADAERVSAYCINGNAEYIEAKGKVVKTSESALKSREAIANLSGKLAAPFPFVRIDFLEIGDQLIVEFMEFFPEDGFLSGLGSLDKEMGELLKLPKEIIYDKEAFFEKVSPEVVYAIDGRIDERTKEQYCLQKAYAQMKYLPDLKNPKTFNEKIIWLALNYEHPDIITACDKITAKDYIAGKVGAEHVVPLIGAFDRVEEIDYEALPQRFVMKSNCGWGNDSVIIVKDKNHIAWDYECAKMTQWLYPWTSYYYKNMGASTEKIVPRILIEEFIGDDSGLDDYKFYCFNGEPQFALTVSGRNEGTQSRTFVDMDWKPLPIRRGGKATAGFPKKPENVEKMIELARVLSKDFPLVRVDFYEVAGQVIVGELTFTPGMFLRLNPLEMDYIIGDKLDISELVRAKNNK